MTLRCHKVLITGGGSGIGFAIAQKLVALGAKVVITGRTEEKLQKATAALGPQAYYLTMDVTDVSRCAACIAEAAEMMGGLDGLVNNAGACAYTHEWGEGMYLQTEEEWDRVMNTNVKAPFFLSRAAVEYMRKNNVQGNIHNVISEAAFVPASASYGASKHALKALTEGLSGHAIRFGIVVNAIAPGTTATDFVDIEGELQKKRQKNGRLATAEEIAELSVFMMSVEGENIIGQTFLSCGGSTI